MVTENRQFWLRPLERKDVETVAAFEREIAKVSFPDDPITDLGFYAKKVGRLIGDPNVATFVAEDRDGVIGWSYVSVRQNFITKEAYADYHSIYISESQRGSGVSRALVEAVFDFCRARKLDRVVFRTRATNERMKSVLARHGFEPAQIYYEKQFADGDAAPGPQRA
jgi:RimJ/RimL family protein N-acetyltransferase